MDLVLIWLVALALAVLAMKIDARRNDVLYGGFIDGRRHDDYGQQDTTRAESATRFGARLVEIGLKTKEVRK